MDGPGLARHIDSVLTLRNLVAVQWVQGYGRDQPIMQWVPLIREIQQAGKSVMVDLAIDEIDEFMAAVDPAGIMLWVPAEPKDQPQTLEMVKRW